MLRENLGKNVRARRKALKLSLVKLQDKSGVSKSSIGYIENLKEREGTGIPLIEKLAKALNCPAWYLLVDPELFDPFHVFEAKELLDTYLQLSDQNRRKVETYIIDLKKTQE